MEVSDQPFALIYMDMDGVMINSRDNAKRMEGKVAFGMLEMRESKYYELIMSHRFIQS